MDYQQRSYCGLEPQPVKSGLAIASLALGVASVLTFCTCGGLLGLPGLILGCIAIMKGQSKGMAIAGIITSILGILFLLLAIIVIAFSEIFGGVIV